MASRGQPTKYTDKIALEICERLAKGESLESICKSDHLPTSETVRQWKRSKKDFSLNYTHAREDQGEYYGQKVQDVANKVMALEIPPDVGRVVMDGFKWTAARMNRAVYGDKTQLTGPNGDDPVKIEVASPVDKLREVLNAKSKRIGGTSEPTE